MNNRDSVLYYIGTSIKEALENDYPECEIQRPSPEGIIMIGIEGDRFEIKITPFWNEERK